MFFAQAGKPVPPGSLPSGELSGLEKFKVERAISPVAGTEARPTNLFIVMGEPKAHEQML